MKCSIFWTIVLLAAGFVLTGCQAEPDSQEDRNELHDKASRGLRDMEGTDPGLAGFLSRAEGYVIFPAVGKGALIAGGAYGRGEVYEKGQFVGYADITQATIGAQVGGQSFAELIVFESKDVLSTFEYGQTTLTANASAIAIKAGAAASATYQNGLAVFVEPIAGLMVEAAVGGQTFSYQRKE